jgi:molybdopterin molybdotransferase
MRELLTVEQYQAELLELVHPDARVESVPLAAASGRVLAQDVVSGVSIPVFANSAMDGYAVRFAEAAEVPATLQVVGDVAAGSAADPEVGPGACVRIMTGAPLPTFADTVVPVEDTDGGLATVTVTRAPDAAGKHVRGAGEDFVAGARIAVAGTTVTPAVAGELAAVGLTSVPVRPRPIVALRSTGDELVTDGSALGRGQIYESNSIVLAAMLAAAGADVRRAHAARDEASALAAWLDGTSADLIVLTGGASVGAFDVVRDVLEAAGGTFRSVRVQPGKPQGWAVWNGVPVVSLPGNPLSAALSWELFVAPLLDRILGRPGRPWLTAVAGADWASPPGRRQLVPVRLSTDADGRLIAVPAHRRGSASHVVSSLAQADGYCAVAEDVAAVAVGDLLPVRWL